MHFVAFWAAEDIWFLAMAALFNPFRQIPTGNEQPKPSESHGTGNGVPASNQSINRQSRYSISRDHFDRTRYRKLKNYAVQFCLFYSWFIGRNGGNIPGGSLTAQTAGHYGNGRGNQNYPGSDTRNRNFFHADAGHAGGFPTDQQRAVRGSGRGRFQGNNRRGNSGFRVSLVCLNS